MNPWDCGPIEGNAPYGGNETSARGLKHPDCPPEDWRSFRVFPRSEPLTSSGEVNSIPLASLFRREIPHVREPVVTPPPPPKPSYVYVHPRARRPQAPLIISLEAPVANGPGVIDATWEPIPVPSAALAVIPPPLLCGACGGYGMHGVNCPTLAEDEREESKPEAGPDGRPVLSASQVDTYLDCARKWAFKYIERVKDDGHPSTKVGKKVHTVLEHWLRDAKLPDMNQVLELETRNGLQQYFPGQIAQAGLHLLPPPGVCKVEGAFRLNTRSSRWRGFKDAQYILDPRSGMFFPPHPVLAMVPGNVFVVLDHKSTSNFRWMKTPDILKTDVQSIIYAASAMEEMQVRKVRNRWAYYLTSGQPKARVVEVDLTAEDVAARMEFIDATAADIHRLYQLARPAGPGGPLKLRALDLPPTIESCEKYGGCPHANTRCHISTDERMVAIMARESIKEMMERKQAERNALAASGAPSVVPVPPPMGAHAPPAAPTAPAIPAAAYWQPGHPLNPAQEYLRGKGSPLSVIASAADVPPPEHIAKAYDAGGTTPGVGVINPPEAPPVAPSHPGEMPPVAPVPGSVPPAVDDLTAMDRDKLKVLAVSLGLADASSRLREDGFRTLIREARAKVLAATGGPPAVPTAPTAATAPAVPRPPTWDWMAAARSEGWQPHTDPLYWWKGTELRKTADMPAAFTPAPAVPVAPPVPPAPPAPVGLGLASPFAPEIPSGTAPVSPEAPKPSGGGFILMVNCAPMRTAGWEVYHLSEILGPVLDKLHKDKNVSDFRMVEYGAGPGLLAAYLREYLLDLGLNSNTVVVCDSRTSEGAAVLRVLEDFARDVVRATA